MSDKPMDWVEYAGARQALLEEFIGTRIREAKAHEDAQARDALKHISQR